MVACFVRMTTRARHSCVEAEAVPTHGSTIWRYMRFRPFAKVLEDKALYLPNAYTYEDTDVNEGRFGQRYVDVLRRAYVLACVQTGMSPTAAKREAQVNLGAHCALLKAYRQWSYIRGGLINGFRK